MSAPHFQTLFRTFSEFKMLKRNSAVWNMDNELIVFYKLSQVDYSLYLLCMLKSQPEIVEKARRITA